MKTITKIKLVGWNGGRRREIIVLDGDWTSRKTAEYALDREKLRREHEYADGLGMSIKELRKKRPGSWLGDYQKTTVEVEWL